MDSSLGVTGAWTRKVKPMWLPGQGEQPEPRPEVTCARQSSAAEDSSEDELDKLTAQYASEAAADTRAVAQKQHLQSEAQKGMAELREGGLAKPLDSTNRGFQLLSKMGYVEGKGLGNSVNGRVAPIDVDLKGSRAGLGVDEEKKRRKSEKVAQQQEREQKRARLQKYDHSRFLELTTQKYSNTTADRHVGSARKVIETLDARTGIPQHHMWPPWPPADGQNPDGTEGEAEQAELHPWELLPPQQRLEDALSYLREQHHYCLFCGCQYEDVDDLEANCPGLTEEQH